MRTQLLFLVTVMTLNFIPLKAIGETLLCVNKNASEKMKIELTFDSTGIFYKGAFFRLEDKFENHAIFISKQKHSGDKNRFMVGLSVLQVDMQNLDVEIGSVFSVSKLGNLKVPEIVLLPSIFLKCRLRQFRLEHIF